MGIITKCTICEYLFHCRFWAGIALALLCEILLLCNFSAIMVAF